MYNYHFYNIRIYTFYDFTNKIYKALLLLNYIFHNPHVVIKLSYEIKIMISFYVILRLQDI